MKDQIFIALSSFAEHDKRPLDLLHASGYSYKIHNSGKRITTSELLHDGADASVILAGVEQYDAKILRQLSRLKCISRCGVGLDSIDLSFAKQRGVKIINTPGIPTQAVAELALCMFLALSRNLSRQLNSMRNGEWERFETHLLSGRTVGLIGFGSIGQQVAKLCQAFGARVIAHDPYIEENKVKELGVRMVSKENLLTESDIVSLHASKGDGNTVLIGKKDLLIMKDKSFLVNLARGDMVDETALIEALASGKIGGVGLDVFEHEPYAGPLSKFEQVLLTPHSATNTIETRSAMEIKCVENAINFLNGAS